MPNGGINMILKNLFKPYNYLPMSIYALFFAKIINGIGNFVFPFLTLFLTTKLMFSAKLTGMFIFIAAIAFVPGSLIGGKLSDHFGRKKIYLLFQLSSAISLIPCAFLGNSLLIPWFLILATFFSGGSIPASGAMITDLTTSENREAAFSLLYLGNNIGNSVGALIAGFLYRNYTEWLFLGNALIIIIALIFVVFFVPETIPRDNLSGSAEINFNEKAEKGSVLKVLLKRPSLIIFSLLCVIYSFVYSQYTFLLPMYVDNLFLINGSKVYGTLMTVSGLTVAFLTPLAIITTKKYNPLLNTTLAGLFYIIGFGIIYFIGSIYLFILSTIIWTIGQILFSTNSNVYIANLTPISHRGRFNSVIPLIVGAGFAIGPAIMGLYVDKYTIKSAWLLLAVLASISSSLMFTLYLNDKKNKAARV